MIIDKEGRLFGKISLIDIFTIIIIAVLAFGVYTRFFASNEKVDVQGNVIEYKMRITKVRQGTFDALSKLGPLYDEKTKEYLGEITEAYAEPYFEAQTKEDGSLVLKEVPDRMNVIINVRTNGYSGSAGYYTSQNKYVAAGSGFDVVSKYAKTSGEVISVTEIEN